MQVSSLQAQISDGEARRRGETKLATVNSIDVESKIAAAEAEILKRAIGLIDSRSKDMLRRWEELEERTEGRLAAKAADDEERLMSVAKVGAAP